MRALGDLEGDEGLDAEAGRGHVDVRAVGGTLRSRSRRWSRANTVARATPRMPGELQGAGLRALPQRGPKVQVEGVKGRSGSHLAVRLREICFLTMQSAY